MMEDERIAMATNIMKGLQDQSITFIDGVAILGMALVLAAQGAQAQIRIEKHDDQERRRG
jgi:hypothetical protein